MLSSLAAIALVAVAALRPVPAPVAPPAPPDTGGSADDGVLDEPGWKGAVDRFQARRRPLAFIVGVIRKFSDDQAGRLAALIAYYGFFSLFPALLALTTVLGFVLERDATLRTDIRDSALGQFPVIGESLGSAGQPLAGNVVGLVIGLFAALWAGMGAIQAAQDAMNSVWDVPRARTPSFLMKRVRSVLTLLLIVVPLLANVVVPHLIGAFTSGFGGWLVYVIASVVIDVGVFAVAFRVLTAAPLTWNDVLPGAVVAAVGYVALQNLGTLYVDHVLTGAEDTYGTFAVVIGLLSWMYVLGQVIVFAAEINVVRARALWPRSLFGAPRTASDRSSQIAQAEESEMSDEADVSVHFQRPGGSR